METPITDPAPETALSIRLEAGEVIAFQPSLFPLPQPDDLAFLREQRCAAGWKNINYDPKTDRLRGAAGNSERLRSVMADFSRSLTVWLASQLPEYAADWTPDQATFRPEEESARRLPTQARNDLLHVDGFPGRPSRGRRILRVFANVHPTASRIWITSWTFPKLLDQYGEAVGLPGREGLTERTWNWIAGLAQPSRRRRPEYDAFMLRLHDFLKNCREFQTEVPARQRFEFPPGTAWLAFTDSATHAVLGGRFALEHSYFIEMHSLRAPDRAPAALLARAANRSLDALTRAK